MFGLNKKRTIFGRWADKNKILQREVEEDTGLSSPVISRVYNDPTYPPSRSTRKSILNFARSHGWANVKDEDLWPPM